MASKSNKGEILAKFFDDGEYTALLSLIHISAPWQQGFGSAPLPPRHGACPRRHNSAPHRCRLQQMCIRDRHSRALLPGWGSSGGSFPPADCAGHGVAELRRFRVVVLLGIRMD